MPVKYSVIIPVYNCAAYLEACVSSILAQTIQDYEILLIDDGATDNSGELCDKFAERDSRIRVYHKMNGGAATARNYGLDYAEGEFVLFIDSDDTIASNCLETIDTAASVGTMVIYGMTFEFYRKKTLIRREQYSCGYSETYRPEEIAKNFYDFFKDNQLSSACNKVFDRRIIEQRHLRFSEGMTVYEDFDFVIHYLRYVSSVVCLPIPLYIYRVPEKGGNLDRRIGRIDQLRNNMVRLSGSLLAFYDVFPEKQVLSVSANLYLQLLDQHLLCRRKLTANQLRADLPQYCSESVLIDTLAYGVSLTDAEANLLRMIQNGNFSAIVRKYRKRRLKIRTKLAVKRLIKY